MTKKVMIPVSAWNTNYVTKKYLTLASPNERKCSLKFKPNTPNLLCSAVILLVAIITIAEACQISEYYCDNRKCVSLDKFCNGIDEW